MSEIEKNAQNLGKIWEVWRRRGGNGGKLSTLIHIFCGRKSSEKELYTDLSTLSTFLRS